MLGTILAIITGLGPTVVSITGKILDLKSAQTVAQTEVQKAQIGQQISEANDRRDIIVAEAGSRIGLILSGLMRGLIALGPALYLLKVFLWDKVIGSFVGCSGKFVADNCDTYSTDPLDVNLWWVVMAVLAFYLAYDIASRIRK